MPSLANHHSSEVTKLLSIGDAMTGKTGSLASLVAEGYKLRILDFDNKLDVLKQFILRDCPDKLGNVEYFTLRDQRKSGPLGPVIVGKPQAFRTALNMIDHWKYTDETGAVDLGRPDSWGPGCILVLDSLSRLCDAAYDHYEPLVPRGKNGDYDPRAVYGNAQDGVEAMLAHLTSKGFGTNVIVMAHIKYLDMPDGTIKGFPQTVGKALSPNIPSYFPAAVLYTMKNNKRVIRTAATPLIDLANPKPFEMSAEYDLGDGLAKIFATLRGQSVAKAEPKPAPEVAKKSAAATLRRA